LAGFQLTAGELCEGDREKCQSYEWLYKMRIFIPFDLMNKDDEEPAMVEALSCFT
jgi:hypothetical protein